MESHTSEDILAAQIGHNEEKRGDTKVVGRWVAGCKNTWGRKGEHDQNTFYKTLNALIKIVFEEEFTPFNNNFKFEWPQLPNQKALISGMDWETNFLNFCWCETHVTFKDTLFWVKSCKKELLDQKTRRYYYLNIWENRLESKINQRKKTLGSDQGNS